MTAERSDSNRFPPLLLSANDKSDLGFNGVNLHN